MRRALKIKLKDASSNFLEFLPSQQHHARHYSRPPNIDIGQTPKTSSPYTYFATCIGHHHYLIFFTCAIVTTKYYYGWDVFLSECGNGGMGNGDGNAD